jgi:signal transduction histidine kinase
LTMDAASEGAAGGPAWAPRLLAPEAMSSVLSASPYGVAVVDDQGRFVYLNPAGARILATSPSAELLQPAPFAQAAADGDAGVAALIRLRRSDGSERVIEYAWASFTADGRRLTAVTFRDVTDDRVQQQRLNAFAAAAHSVAYAGSLRATLNKIAGEIVRTAGLAAAQVLTYDPVDLRMQVHGLAGSGGDLPEDFAVRVEQVRRAGGELLSLDAMRTGRPSLRRRRRKEMLADPAWRPLHGHLSSFDWEDFVAVPLVVRGRPLGALNAYYLPGHHPDASDIAFLAAMADQAAIAVENARLFADSKARAELEERHRIARDLHDSITQDLFSLTLHGKAAALALQQRGFPADDPLVRSVSTAQELAYEALNGMRTLIFELYPTTLRARGLATTVRQLASSITVREGLHVELDAPPDLPGLEPETEEAAYRFVQEALNNVIKHAKATSVRIFIGRDPADDATLVLEVSDNGYGFDPASVEPGGLGLVSMAERMERLGGMVRVASRPGSGTTVRATVPRVLRDPA